MIEGVGDVQRLLRSVLPVALVTVLLPLAPSSRAAFPGGDGLIVFESTRTGNREIFVMQPDGTGVTNLSNDPEIDSDPAWSPDGTQIAFTSRRDGSSSDIFVMNADGSGVVNLTPGPEIGLNPAWSPDGTRLAYEFNHDIFVLEIGGGMTNITGDASDVGQYEPAWSPDGERIAFRKRVGSDSDIWTMAPDGSNQVNLTNTPGGDKNEQIPSWTGDGQTIVYERFGDIWKMNANGSGQTNVTGAGSGREPSASPSGTQIVYTDSADNNEELFLVSSDGSGITRLTSTPGEDENADWQPTDPPPGIFILDAYAHERASGTSQMEFTVGVDGPLDIPVSVDYRTRDKTATAGSDYRRASGSVTLQPGETEKTIAVTVLPDTKAEGEETFFVDLSRPVGARVQDGRAVGMIDEAADLSVSLAQSRDFARTGKRITYTTAVSNKGPSTGYGVVMSVILPPGVKFESATLEGRACSQQGRQVNCSIGRLDVDETKRAKVVVVAPKTGGTISMQASVVGNGIDPQPADNGADLSTMVIETGIDAGEPEAVLDWHLRARYRDYNGDGILDQVFNSPEDMNRPFELAFFGCSSSPSGDITEYKLEVSVGGEVITWTDDSCTFEDHGWLEVPTEGTYPATLTITTASGETSSVTEDVTFNDYLIFSLGDSVGSGEGNPDVPAVNGHCGVKPDIFGPGTCPFELPKWQNARCHRTADAGSSLAARQLENSSGTSSVTFVHLACSGAGVVEGILGTYPGIDDKWAGHPYGGTRLPPQADVMGDIMSATGRSPDAVLISVGANDAHFGAVVLRCLAPDKCHLDHEFTAEVAEAMAKLPGLYREVDARLRELGIASSDVYISEYFDPMRDENANWGRCMQFDFIFGTTSLISPQEFEWGYENVISELNKGVRSTASLGWNVVTGIAAEFKRHGYCATKDSYVRTLTESPFVQAGIHGAFHPNLQGHAVYGRKIHDKLKAGL